MCVDAVPFRWRRLNEPITAQMWLFELFRSSKCLTTVRQVDTNPHPSNRGSRAATRKAKPRGGGREAREIEREREREKNRENAVRHERGAGRNHRFLQDAIFLCRIRIPELPRPPTQRNRTTTPATTTPTTTTKTVHVTIKGLTTRTRTQRGRKESES